MTTRIVFELALWLLDSDATPERGTNVMVLVRFAHPRLKARLVARAATPYFRFRPIE
jgi:hypothetical protein